MDFQKRPSGLAIPVAPPRQPARQFGPLEIQDEDRRQQAKRALGELWIAMGLRDSSAIPQPVGRETREALWLYVASVLLGDDCPECEQFT